MSKMAKWEHEKGERETITSFRGIGRVDLSRTNHWKNLWDKNIKELNDTNDFEKEVSIFTNWLKQMKQKGFRVSVDELNARITIEPMQLPNGYPNRNYYKHLWNTQQKTMEINMRKKEKENG